MNSIFKSSSCLTDSDLWRYLKDELSPDDRVRVENHLLDCELCSNAVEAASKMDEADFAVLRKELTAAFRNLSAQPDHIEGRYYRRKRIILFNRLAAAVLLILIITASLLYYANQFEERLFARYYHAPESDYVVLRSAGKVPPSFSPELEQGLVFYEMRDYNQAIPHFENHLEMFPEDFEALFLLAIAALEEGYLVRTSDYLEVVRINHLERYADATWYLGLTLLKLDEREKSVALLQELMESQANDPQKVPARSLLERLQQQGL